MSNKLSKIVVDVSTWQGVIDWDTLRPYIDGAIIRATYGKEGVDAQFERNWKACERLEIPYGVYHYSYAKNVDDARLEATHTIEVIDNCKLSYPVYFDAEDSSLPYENYNLRAVIEEYGNCIEGEGLWCGVYANSNWWTNRLVGLERFTKWIAQWANNLSYTGDNVGMWQYTNKGELPGIDGNVDMNICFIDYPALINDKKAESVPEVAPDLQKCMDELVETMRKHGIIK